MTAQTDHVKEEKVVKAEIDERLKRMKLVLLYERVMCSGGYYISIRF